MPKIMAKAEVIDALLEFYKDDLEKIRFSPITGAQLPPGSRYAETCRLGLGLYKPQIAFFWGKDIAFSHLDMYRPYIRRTGRRAIVIAKSLKTKTPETIGLPNVPVFMAKHDFRASRDLAGITSLDTVFHITEAAENYAFIKNFPNYIHVYANHSDSDKHASITRSAAAYDFVLAADRVSMLRYAQAALPIPQEKFAVIGGAPIEGVEVAESFGEIRKVLYTPTWEGHSETVNFSSLHKIADKLVSLNTGKYTLRYRPHPGMGKNSKTHKELSAEIRKAVAAEGKSDKAGDFNWSDVILSDISGVMTEYLFTRKPIIVPIGGEDDWVRHYLAETNLSNFVYLWEYETQDFDEIVRIATQDPLRAKRLARREELFYGTRSIDELCGLFEQALGLFEHVRAQRALLSSQIRRQSMVSHGFFEAMPESPELRDVVQQVRAGTMILQHPM